jgi:hypothetical protein
VYWPDPSETVVVLVPVRISVATIVASGIAAPVASMTEPLMPPRNSCATANVVKRENITKTKHTMDLFKAVFPH